MIVRSGVGISVKDIPHSWRKWRITIYVCRLHVVQPVVKFQETPQHSLTATPVAKHGEVFANQQHWQKADCHNFPHDSAQTPTVTVRSSKTFVLNVTPEALGEIEIAARNWHSRQFSFNGNKQ